MPAISNRHTRNDKRVRAVARDVQHALRVIDGTQVAALDARLGAGKGALKERKKLAA